MRLLALILTSLLVHAPPAEAGGVAGKVNVDASPETRRPRRYYMGPYRSGRTHEVDSASRAKNVVVYIEGLATLPRTTPAPPEPVMRQKDERFVPHVLPILRGTPVTFPNEDDFYHNVFSVVAGDRFDLGRYAKGDRTSSPFEKDGVIVVRCEIHPGMKAYILVLSTPAFTVPEDDGSFRFEGLDPGRYIVRAWHPTEGEQTREVAVRADGVVDVSFSF